MKISRNIHFYLSIYIFKRFAGASGSLDVPNRPFVVPPSVGPRSAITNHVDLGRVRSSVVLDRYVPGIARILACPVSIVDLLRFDDEALWIRLSR